jgi:hopanoid biosynthesis associated protein HpnK
MGRVEPVRRLIVNADDLGRSHSINLAIVQAHREGILTSASLMVNEIACDEAIALARENPDLGVGLHLTLVCGHAALSSEKIPNLANENGRFSDNAVSAGMHYFFSTKARRELRDEIAAQFEKFRKTGLRLDHVNGHLNIHLHPVIFGILMENAEKWGIRQLRLTCDPFWLNARLAKGNWAYRTSHALIYRLLSTRSRPDLLRKKIKHTARVFGLLQNARVDEAYISKLLPELPPGDSELYSHPSLDEFKPELDALISAKTQALVKNLGIQLIRYQDL